MMLYPTSITIFCPIVTLLKPQATVSDCGPAARCGRLVEGGDVGPCDLVAGDWNHRKTIGKWWFFMGFYGIPFIIIIILIYHYLVGGDWNNLEHEF